MRIDGFPWSSATTSTALLLYRLRRTPARFLAARDVLPIVHELVGDPSQHVRAALSANIMGLPSDLGDDEAVKDLLDLVMILLKDEFPDVRLNLIAKLADVSSVMGVKRYASIQRLFSSRRAGSVSSLSC